MALDVATTTKELSKDLNKVYLCPIMYICGGVTAGFSTLATTKPASIVTAKPCNCISKYE